MIEKISYGGWPNCYRIFDNEAELIVTTDVGPRVIRYGFIGGQNMFKEFVDQLGRSGESSWQPRGGHRIWIAPEIVPETYALYNGPVHATPLDTRGTHGQNGDPDAPDQKRHRAYAHVRPVGLVNDGSGRRRHN